MDMQMPIFSSDHEYFASPLSERREMITMVMSITIPMINLSNWI